MLSVTTYTRTPYSWFRFNPIICIGFNYVLKTRRGMNILTLAIAFGRTLSCTRLFSINLRKFTLYSDVSRIFKAKCLNKRNGRGRNDWGEERCGGDCISTPAMMRSIKETAISLNRSMKICDLNKDTTFQNVSFRLNSYFVFKNPRKNT